MASSMSANDATPTIGPNVSVRYRSSLIVTPSTMVGWQYSPASGSPTNPVRGRSDVIRPVAVEPNSLWCGCTRSSHPRNRSRNRSLIIGPYSTSCVGSPIGAFSTAALKRERNSSWMDWCTMAVPSDVQRWPAVAKPLNTAPATARSRSASGITTRGFFPPSSRQGDCRNRPHSSPSRRPTSVDPVNPTLSTTPSSRARSSPANVCGPSASTRLNAPSGSPPCRKSCAKASPMAGVYSAGFHTTAFPHSRAGTRYQDGTATGKFPAVTMAATPTGSRNVNSCLSGISLGTVCPYSCRPWARKKLQVSMTSWTSPSDSTKGLPISRVISRASGSLFSSTRRPICWIARPRTGAGVAAHEGWATRAARHASTKVPASPSCASATTSSRRAGLVERIRPPGAPSSGRPPMIERTVRLMAVASLDHHQGLIVLDDVALLHPDLGDGALPRGGDVVLHLHGFQDAHGIARAHLLTRLHHDLEDRALHRRDDHVSRPASSLAVPAGGGSRGRGPNLLTPHRHRDPMSVHLHDE